MSNPEDKHKHNRRQDKMQMLADQLEIIEQKCARQMRDKFIIKRGIFYKNEADKLDKEAEALKSLGYVIPDRQER